MFIDDEAAVSDDDSDDDDDSFLISQTHFTQNVDEGDPSVDMRAKYLQSIRFEICCMPQQKTHHINHFSNLISIICLSFSTPTNRSPVNQQNFRIPRIGYRNIQATQNIFSQFVEPDDSKYEEVCNTMDFCSFLFIFNQIRMFFYFSSIGFVCCWKR